MLRERWLNHEATSGQKVTEGVWNRSTGKTTTWKAVPWLWEALKTLCLPQWWNIPVIHTEGSPLERMGSPVNSWSSDAFLLDFLVDQWSIPSATLSCFKVVEIVRVPDDDSCSCKCECVCVFMCVCTCICVCTYKIEVTFHPMLAFWSLNNCYGYSAISQCSLHIQQHTLPDLFVCTHTHTPHKLFDVRWTTL